MLSELLPHWSLNNSFSPECLHTWKKSINQAYLENGSYEQIVTHLERELEVSSVEALDELQMSTMTQEQLTEGNEHKAGNIKQTTLTPKIPKMTKNIRLSVYPVERG